MTLIKFLLLLPFLACLAACDSSSDSDDNNSDNNSTTTSDEASSSQDDAVTTIENIDATNGWAYVNLASKSTVQSTDTWHIAFSATSTMTNTDTVTNAIVASQSDFYSDGSANSSVFTNATASSELEHLTAAYDLTDSSYTFATDTLTTAINSGTTKWANYNSTTRAYDANSDAWWVIRNSAADAFAKLNATSISYTDYNSTTHQVSGVSISLNLYIQSATDSGFSTAVTTWTPSSTSDSGAFIKCYDIDSTAEVDCSTDGWDIKADIDYNSYKFNLLLNSGVSGSGSAGASTSYDSDGVNAIASGSDINSRSFVTDAMSNVYTDDATQWYEYNLTGQHKIWPNYRVYAVKVANGATYLMQITSYYNTTDGTTGRYISIRYHAVE
ncbi:hypothetical protein GV054_03960 [Marinomonas mediterranea]|uniref:HmuY family protein n=1 Tax=Marinomonas mediterranea TaxID=119864 RepID=UPI00234AD4B5|nr:HmuY family protein [Marinomonas mediterranea]WCN12220.1 hypothetical protein GV054_03960 [Marinomonas mediterranea]